MDRSVFYPTIDEIVFKVALEYENLYRGPRSKLNTGNISSTKRDAIVAKSGIGYQKRSSSDYVIYIILESYILKKHGDHYMFGGIPLGRNFQLKGNIITFTGAPKILKKDTYNHPFVHDSNEICYNGGSRWRRTDIDIDWNQGYDANQKSTIHKIAKWLEQGKLSLQKGYFGSVTPVSSLGRGSFSSEYKTPVEAVRCGVKIIEN